MTIMRSWLSAFMLVVTAMALAACLGSSSIDGSVGGDGTFTEATPAQSQDAAIGGPAAASAQKIFAANSVGEGADGSKDYKIAPLDVLDIQVFGVPDLNRTAQVSSSGLISMPLIKSVKAGGRTTTQLEKEIASKLEAAYLQSPQVTVLVKEYNSQRITVDGAVKKPGIFPTTGSVSLLQAIALAEGLNEVADPSGILVFRTTNNRRMAARFDLKAVRGGKIQDPILQAGDIVMVDESATRTTLRDVKGALPVAGLFQMLLL